MSTIKSYKDFLIQEESKMINAFSKSLETANH